MSITRKFSVAAVPLMAMSMALVGCDFGANDDSTTQKVISETPQDSETKAVDDSAVRDSSNVAPAVKDSVEKSAENNDPAETPPVVPDSDVKDPVMTDPVATDTAVEDTMIVPATLPTVILAKSASGCFQTWNGIDGKERVLTELDNGSETSGYWFFYKDDIDGGMSIIEIPEESVEDVLQTCGGLCVSFALDKGTLDYNPYVGVGFNLAGMIDNEVQPVDASKMGGIVVAYTSDLSMNVEMGFTDDVEKELKYDVPYMTLPKATAMKTIEIPWSEFRQAGWGTGKIISGEEGARKLASLKFKIQDKSGQKGKFNIIGVAPYDPTCSYESPAPAPESSSSVVGSSSSSDVPKSSSSLVPSNFETWNGAKGVARINTGYDAGMETSGDWYAYTDEMDGGLSTITWPVPLGNGFSANAFDPVVDACGGLCGTFTLDQGTLDYYPFVGVGFYLAGEDENGNIATVDATAMGGVCIVYTSDMSATIEMSLGDDGDREIGYNVPYVTLPKSSVVRKEEFTWAQFRQASWGRIYISGEDAATRLAALNFKIQGKNGSKGTFNIMTIGPYGGCDDKIDVLP